MITCLFLECHVEGCHVEGCHVVLDYHVECCHVVSDATLSSTETRSRPNAFNHFFMYRKKIALGVARDTIIDMWANPRKAKEVYGLGRYEAAAVQNIVNMTEELQQTLQTAASEFGVVKGPISHVGLSSKLFLPGHGPIMPQASFQHRMKTEPSTTILMGKRLVSDFRTTPTAMRKTMGSDAVIELQKRCRGFELLLHDFEVPEINV